MLEQIKINELHSLFLECNTVSTDTRKISKQDLFFALKGDSFDGNTFTQQAINNGAKYVVIDNSEYAHLPQTILVEDVLKTLQHLAAFHRLYLNIPIIALTGSNGKTTTKELINAVLSQKHNTMATVGNLNNHIGVPLTLLSMTKQTEIGIVEMGANHLKEIEFLCDIAKPDYGYITNFGKAHLEGFGSIEGVIKGKSELYSYLTKNNKLIFVNVLDSLQVEKTGYSNTFTFGDSKVVSDVSVNFIEAQPFVTCQYNNFKIESQLIGEYNFNNIAAAIAIGSYFKVEYKDIKVAIESYSPKNNRSQVLERGTNKIILDAYNANPTSMRAALLNFEKQSGNKIAILGDMFELGSQATIEHQNIVDLGRSLNINQLIFIGENFYQSKIDSKKAIKYKSFMDFKDKFSTSLKNSIILIKGSRGMALERILDIL